MDALRQQVGQYLRNRALIRTLEDEQVELAEAIAEQVRPGEQVVLPGGEGVKVQAPPRRVEWALVKEQYPEQYEQACEWVPSTTRITKALAPDQLDQCRRDTGKPIVKVL